MKEEPVLEDTRKNNLQFDSFRPKGRSYSQSIAQHKHEEFCKSLGNGQYSIDTEEAKKKAEYTVEGINGKDERDK